MNKTLPEVEDFCRSIADVAVPDDRTVVIAPSFPFLGQASTLCAENGIEIAAQDVHYADSGAFTGEVSCAQLKSVGCSYIIIGHSERREFFGEKDGFLNKKVHAALNSDLTPIFCVGETAEQRKAERHQEVIIEQIQLGLAELSQEELRHVVIAYEPIWAIGTGNTATEADVAEIHSTIRTLLPAETPIIYGGSVNPENAQQLFLIEQVDGFLVGSASLDPVSFKAICTVSKNK